MNKFCGYDFEQNLSKLVIISKKKGKLIMQKLTIIVYVSSNNNMCTISMCMHKGEFTGSACIYHCVIYAVDMSEVLCHTVSERTRKITGKQTKQVLSNGTTSFPIRTPKLVAAVVRRQRDLNLSTFQSRIQT